MTEKNNIEVFLNIEIGDRRLHPGKKHPNKNKYYYYNELYYIVELTKNKWMILSDDRKTRILLREHVWYYHNSGYAGTRVGRNSTIYYHKLYLNYEDNLVCDHINRKRFDNQFNNLRIVTCKENSRNRTMQHNNTTGHTGICEMLIRGVPYIRTYIENNNGKRLFKSFNVNHLGRDEAFRLAIEQRAAWVREFGYMHN